MGAIFAKTHQHEGDLKMSAIFARTGIVESKSTNLRTGAELAYTSLSQVSKKFIPLKTVK
jgi:hypothetical protein